MRKLDFSCLSVSLSLVFFIRLLTILVFATFPFPFQLLAFASECDSAEQSLSPQATSRKVVTQIRKESHSRKNSNSVLIFNV